jgi:ribosomal protein S27E
MNPLAQYSKIEVLFTKLVSNDVIKYDEGVVSSVKCGVCARSARDEIMMNTPDALLGGDAIVKVIENCVPNVQDANKLYVNDVEQLMIAIKLATKDESYDINVKCPECDELGGFSRDLNYLLQTATSFTKEPSIVMDSGLTVYFKPHTWEQYSDFSVRMFEQHTRSKAMDASTDMSDKEKQDLFIDVFEKMTQLNYDVMCESISKVVTPDGTVVEEREFINDWVGTLSKGDLKIIKEETDALLDVGISHTMDVQCHKCNHEWELSGLRYDPSHFFGLDFSSVNRKK